VLLALDTSEVAWLSSPVLFLATPSLHFWDAVLRLFINDVHNRWAVELGIGGSAFAVATSVASF